jgi:hypothetical protein
MITATLVLAFLTLLVATDASPDDAHASAPENPLA